MTLRGRGLTTGPGGGAARNPHSSFGDLIARVGGRPPGLAARPTWTPPAVLALFTLLALFALLAFLAVEQVGLPLLLAAGLPSGLVRAAGGFKEAMGLLLLGAAAWELARGRQKLDRLDAAVLVYVGVVTFELAFPGVLASDPVRSLNVRALAWRGDCGYPLLLLAVRHSPLAPKARAVFVRVLTALAVFLIAVAVFQRIDPGRFESFVVGTAQLPRYQARVLHAPPDQISLGLQVLGFRDPLRVTSVLLYPFDLADYLLIVLAVLAETLAWGRGPRWMWPALAGAAATIYLTEVRADFFVAGLILLAVLLPAAGRTRRGRHRMALLLAVALAAAAPFIAGSRYLGGHGTGLSDTVHAHELGHAVSVIGRSPLGLGLGHQPATARRFRLSGINADVGDNTVLQVADELGLEGLLPWLVLMALILFEAKRRAGEDPLVLGAGVALAAILLAGQTHPAFVSYAAPWTLMAALGLALPAAPPRR